ncbi:hypothetical protein C8R43DRAFT_942535 [Mycena crocata]|nr:hypothetical protein C8R43DRAFT_942535 [Mycena crocata]
MEERLRYMYPLWGWSFATLVIARGRSIYRIGRTLAEHILPQGDFVRTPCTLQDLLPVYLHTRKSVRKRKPNPRYFPADNPALDLASLSSEHLRQKNAGNLRRSPRLQDLQPESGVEKRARSPSPSSDDAERPDPNDKATLKWLNEEGNPRGTSHTWSKRKGATKGTVPALPKSGGPTAKTRISNNPDPRPKPHPASTIPGEKKKKTRRSGRYKKMADGSVNENRIEQQQQGVAENSDFIQSSTFAITTDATHSTTGWQGAQPPTLARRRIRRLYYSLPDARALRPFMENFTAIPYAEGEGQIERSTFLLDRSGLIILYRSVRAHWLAGHIQDLDNAQAILVGNELQSARAKNKAATGVRGPHLAIIIGHQRQSAVEPTLTAWHREHEAQVEEFLRQDIIRRIFGWVSNIVRIVWPGLAKRFETDAAWHKREHQIEPLFGFFWNFCLNAAFSDQDRIHTGPHVDFKNQIGICMVLTYVNKHGRKKILGIYEYTADDSPVNYNHKRRGWIVLWEAGVYVELPPWTLVGYPSSLFYHFNIDIHDLKIVYTDNDVNIPTPENSQPYDDWTGRGSMVFFSQSTMRHGPATGFDTLAEAAAAGASSTTDYGDDAQAAFNLHAHFQPVPIDTDVDAGEDFWDSDLTDLSDYSD